MKSAWTHSATLEFFDALHAAKTLREASGQLECALEKCGIKILAFAHNCIWKVSDATCVIFHRNHDDVELAQISRIFAVFSGNSGLNLRSCVIRVLVECELQEINYSDHRHGFVELSSCLFEKHFREFLLIKRINDYNEVGFAIQLDSGVNQAFSHQSIKQLDRILSIFSDRILFEPGWQYLHKECLAPRLNSTEKAVLTGLSEGRALKDIALDVDKSYKYVANRVVENLKQKLGGVTRDQLLYLAGKVDLAAGQSKVETHFLHGCNYNSPVEASPLW